MNDYRVIRVFEHERLCIGSKGFEKRHWDLLARWAGRRKEHYLEVWHSSVKFLQWVGVIEVDGLVIEVLPKAESDRSHDDSGKIANKWRGILVDLLGKAYHINLRGLDDASIGIQRRTLLDLLFERYLDAIERLIVEGLVKRYRGIIKDRNAVKGRIDHIGNIRINVAHAERIRTFAFEYDRINTLNLIIRAGVDATASFAPSAFTRARAKSIGLNFADWPSKAIKTSDFLAVRYDRKTEGYRTAIRLARLILGKQNPDLAHGKEKVFSMLFDMNDLWEKATLYRLRRECLKNGFVKIRGQSFKLFWRAETGTVKTLRPDIMMERQDGKQVVVDTKWKILSAAIPGDEDLRQIFAYEALWKAVDGFLLYPQAADCQEEVGSYSVPVDDKKARCGVLFAQVDPKQWAQDLLLERLGLV